MILTYSGVSTQRSTGWPVGIFTGRCRYYFFGGGQTPSALAAAARTSGRTGAAPGSALYRNLTLWCTSSDHTFPRTPSR